MDLGAFYHLFSRHIRKYAGKALCHHGFSCSRRTYYQYLVPACRGYLKGSLYILLALDLREIRDGLFIFLRP